jgi:hypothetical protein
MAFARDVNRQPISQLTALTVTPERVDSRPPIPSVMLPLSERDQIQQRVNDFRAHQEKMKREREDYYSQVKARMTASATLLGLNKNPLA